MPIQLISVDNDIDYVQQSIPLFAFHGFEVVPCTTITRALKQIRVSQINNLLLDIDFPGNPKEGLHFLEEINTIAPDTNVVLFTGYPDLDDSVRSIRNLMAVDYLQKTYRTDEELIEFFDRLRASFTENNRHKAHNLVYKEENKLRELRRAFQINDLTAFKEVFQSIFANLPYDMKLSEGFFHALIHILLDVVGIEIQSERETNKGRIDAVVQTNQFVYLIEFKLENVASAIDQIKLKEYFQPFLHGKKEIILVGIAFDTKEGNLMQLVHEKYIR